MFITVLNFNHSLAMDDFADMDKQTGGRVYNKVLGVASALLLVNSAITEFKQFHQLWKSGKPGNYFRSVFNWIDLSGIVLTLLVTITTIFEL